MDLKHDVHKPNESILCPKCGDIFNSRAKLSTHIASKHKIRVSTEAGFPLIYPLTHITSKI